MASSPANSTMEGQRLLALLLKTQAGLAEEETKASVSAQASLIATLYKEISTKISMPDQNSKKIGTVVAFLAFKNLKADQKALFVLHNMFIVKEGKAILNTTKISEAILNQVIAYNPKPNDLLCWVNAGKLAYSPGRSFVKTLQPSLSGGAEYGALEESQATIFTEGLLSKLPDPNTSIFFASCMSQQGVDFTDNYEIEEEGKSLQRNSDLDDLF